MHRLTIFLKCVKQFEQSLIILTSASDELIKIVPGPDFPTGGYIVGKRGISEAYKTGRGIIKVRGRAFVEKFGQNRERITSLKSLSGKKGKLLEKIAEQVKEKKIEGISEIRDESDRDGMRIAIELKRDGNPMVILNRLYKFTQMEVSFGIIFLAIYNGRPKVFNLKEILHHFVSHRREIVVRRTIYDLKKAEARAHILEGLKKALDFLDDIIELIRSSSDGKEAKSRLMADFSFTEIQAQAILDMRLQRLTGLEREKIIEEYQGLIKDIERFKAILENPSMVLRLIRDETEEIQTSVW